MTKTTSTRPADSDSADSQRRARELHFHLQVFLTKLEEVESHKRRLTQFDFDFVSDMRDKWRAREDLKSLGMKGDLWSPSAKQLNYLESIASDLRSDKYRH